TAPPSSRVATGTSTGVHPAARPLRPPHGTTAHRRNRHSGRAALPPTTAPGTALACARKGARWTRVGEIRDALRRLVGGRLTCGTHPPAGGQAGRRVPVRRDRGRGGRDGAARAPSGPRRVSVRPAVGGQPASSAAAPPRSQ